MSLNTTSAWVKEIAGISSTEYDSLITSLISTWTPVLELSIDDEYLDDTGNTDLQAALNLGANEMIAGELLAIQRREEGGAETIQLGTIQIKPWMGSDPADPFALKRQARARLAPYTKTGLELAGNAPTGGVKIGIEPEVIE